MKAETTKRVMVLGPSYVADASKFSVQVHSIFASHLAVCGLVLLW